MSLALIEESAKEVRRLAIAGSPLAVGDFRLKKLIAPLEQAGAKIPVFAQLAKSISDLVNGTESDSAARLLQLSTLLNAILYTQGQSGADGNLREMEVFVTQCSSTRTTARVLKPLVEALTSSGAGRFDAIKTACERGAFNDLRLIDPTIRALGDNYPELADLVAEKILPGYGPGIVPRLKATLDLKGNKHDARKLALMHQLDPGGTLELCRTALDDGSPDVKAAAITCLGKHEECIPLVLEQTKAKNKLVRAAALEALAEHDRPDITTLFTDLIKGKALDILARPFRALRNRQVLNALLEEGKRVFDLILKGDSEQIPRFAEILECLKERRDTETEEFVLRCFTPCEKIVKLKASKNSHIAGADLVFHLTKLLYDIGSPLALKTILAKRDAVPPEAFTTVLWSALRTWTPEKVHQEFAPFLQEKKGWGKNKAEIVRMTLMNINPGGLFPATETYETELERQAMRAVKLDPRWLDAAVKTDQEVLVCCLARQDHKGSIDYLLNILNSQSQAQSGLAIQALARCEYPRLTDLFLSEVTKRTKGAMHYEYHLRTLFESARCLPPADLPRLDAFATKLDEKFVDHFLEALAPLRSNAAAA